jgi:hypothetical protein
VRDFYSTMAQVFPVLMLALVWESQYLQRLRTLPRPHRRVDPVSGVLFWTKPRVRIWTIVIAAVTVLEITFIGLILAGLLPDNVTMRCVILAGLAVVLGTLLTRAVVDIIDATRESISPTESQMSPGRHRDPE